MIRVCWAVAATLAIALLATSCKKEAPEGPLHPDMQVGMDKSFSPGGGGPKAPPPAAKGAESGPESAAKGAESAGKAAK